MGSQPASVPAVTFARLTPPWKEKTLRVVLTGIETGQTSASGVANRSEEPEADAPQDDSSRPEVLASPSSEIAPTDPVEAALAKALGLAAAAGRFDVVAQLARELEGRRCARAVNVVQLDTSRRLGRVGEDP